MTACTLRPGCTFTLRPSCTFISDREDRVIVHARFEGTPPTPSHPRSRTP